MQRRHIQVDTIQIDLRARKLFKDGKHIYLTYMEWKLLMLFICNHGAFLSHQTILNAVWGELYDRGCLYKMVQKLRRKIGEQFIETAHRAGYRFVEVDGLELDWYELNLRSREAEKASDRTLI